MPSEWGSRIIVDIRGTSHGEKLAVTVKGLPAGEKVDIDALRAFLRRRAPGQSAFSSARREPDEPVITAGLSDGVTTGETLCAEIANTDVRRGDYAALRGIPRPGHADFAAYLKYGADFDMSGGGRFSGRMTAPLCLAGGICRQILEKRGVRIAAHILELDGIFDTRFDSTGSPAPVGEEFPVLSAEAGERMRAAIAAAAAAGDSVGGRIECMAAGYPAGVGGALFDGLEGRLASALFAVPAVKSVEFGEMHRRGSENNDAVILHRGVPTLSSNHAGGILGGISCGMPILFTVGVKPTPSIAAPQRTVDLNTMEETEICVSGRHDPCILPRAVPVIEAAAAIALLDALTEDDDERA